jgi:UDP-glucose-4-epimerase GalE
MSVLVTGGAGYIGSHTVRLLRATGRDVVVIDDLSSGHVPALLGAPLVLGDVADHDLVVRVAHDHGVDAVIHFAALKAAGESMQQAARYFRANTGGTLRLLEALTDTGVDRFVFSSTAAVYGEPERLPLDETHPMRPTNPYGESKLLVERTLPWLAQAHGLQWVSLRYFNAAGASADGAIGEDFSVVANLVPVLMKALLGRGPTLQVFGTDYDTRDGTALRDYVHVEDLAEAHVKALEHLEHGGSSEVVNLGTGTGSTVLEVIAAVERASGRAVPYELTGRRPGDPAAVVADNTRARELLDWRPDRTLDTVASSAWQWHSAHPEGYAAER